jgi:hypothetical protein
MGGNRGLMETISMSWKFKQAQATSSVVGIERGDCCSLVVVVLSYDRGSVYLIEVLTLVLPPSHAPKSAACLSIQIGG